MGKLFFQTLLSDELVFEWAVDPWLCLRIVFLLMAECYLFFATPVRTFIPKKDYCGAHPRLHIFAQFNFAKMFAGVFQRNGKNLLLLTPGSTDSNVCNPLSDQVGNSLMRVWKANNIYFSRIWGKSAGTPAFVIWNLLIPRRQRKSLDLW